MISISPYLLVKIIYDDFRKKGYFIKDEYELLNMEYADNSTITLLYITQAVKKLISECKVSKRIMPDAKVLECEKDYIILEYKGEKYKIVRSDEWRVEYEFSKKV